MWIELLWPVINLSEEQMVDVNAVIPGHKICNPWSTTFRLYWYSVHRAMCTDKPMTNEWSQLISVMICMVCGDEGWLIHDCGHEAFHATDHLGLNRSGVLGCEVVVHSFMHVFIIIYSRQAFEIMHVLRNCHRSFDVSHLTQSAIRNT
jgi:hypothetical protein